MARIVQKPLYRVYHLYPSIKRYGLAVQYFPCFIQRQKNLHSVDVVLLSFAVRGRGHYLLDEEVRPIESGSVAITHYGQMHDVVTDARGVEIYNVYLDLRKHTLPVLPESLRPTLSAILPIHPRLLHHLNRGVWIDIAQPAKLAASLRRIEEEMNSCRPGALEIVQHSFQIFLIDLCRAAQSHGFAVSQAHTGSFYPWVEKLRDGLDRDFARPHDLRTLARKAGVSVAYLCRLFKSYTGKTVIGYLVERRVQAAIWKLREGDEKVISIALACGFNDLAYFNRAFKRIVGTSPSRYRLRIKRAVVPAGE